MPERAGFQPIDRGLPIEAVIGVLNERLPRLAALLARVQQPAIRTVNASGALTGGDDLVLVDTTAGTVTLTPPAARSLGPHVFELKRIAGANSIVFDPAGAETVDGAATLTTTAARVVCTGITFYTLP